MVLVSPDARARGVHQDRHFCYLVLGGFGERGRVPTSDWGCVVIEPLRVGNVISLFGSRDPSKSLDVGSSVSRTHLESGAEFELHRGRRTVTHTPGPSG